MYKTYSDAELRRVLGVNPKDAEALVEAADRFLASAGQEEIDAAYDSGYADARSDGNVVSECPHCGEAIE